MEAEIKLLLPSRTARDALLNELGASHLQGVKQTNYFFDTSSGALRSANFHVRLRSEVDMDAGEHCIRWVVTVKGPNVKPPAGTASMAVRPEEEVVVPAEAAEAMLADGSASRVLDALPPSELIASVRTALRRHGEPLELSADKYENRRICARAVLHTTAGPQSTTLEVDTTTYSHVSGASEDQWEVECELPPSDASALAAPIERALQDLLRRVCGAECAVAKGKRKRLRQFNERVAAGCVKLADHSSTAAPAAASAAVGAGTMLSFERQTEFEAWLSRCPLPSHARTDYGVNRTAAGLSITTRWLLPLPSAPAQADSSAPTPAVATSTTVQPATTLNPASSPDLALNPGLAGPPSRATTACATQRTIDALRTALEAPPAAPREGVGDTLANVQRALAAAAAPAARPASAPSDVSAATIASVRAAIASSAVKD